MQPLSRWFLRNKGYVRQTFVCCSVSILPFVYGMLQTWPSLALERILDGAAGFAVTRDDISIIVTMITLGMIVMPIVFGFVLVKTGRKTNLLLSSVIYIVAWALIRFASSPIWLIVGNLAGGLGCAVVIIIGPIYIAEIGDKRIRGALVSSYVTVIAIGQIFMTSVGIFIPYNALNLVALILSVISFLSVFVFAVESPSWHLMHNDDAKAEKCFRYYWNSNMQCVEDRKVVSALAELRETVETEMESACSYRELFRTPSNVRASIIVIALSLFQGASGVVAVLTYGSITLPKYDGFWQPNPTMALVTTLNLVFNIVSVGLVDKLGRKPLSIISNAGDALGTGIVALYFFCEKCTSWDTTDIKWLPYVGILVYIASYGCGMAALPHILVGELFPTNVRYHASVVSVCCIAASCAFFNYIYLSVTLHAGVWMMYLIFTLCSAAATLFSWYYVFETKNMTLADIQLKAMGLSGQEMSRARLRRPTPAVPALYI